MNEINKVPTMDNSNSNSSADTYTDDDCGAQARNNYFVGKRLSPNVFQSEQRYYIERRQLLNRAIHGWGVVYGLGVKGQSALAATGGLNLVIDAGMALDEAGREILNGETANIAFKDLWAPDLPPIPATGAPTPAPTCWVLKVHYAERLVGPVSLRDACSCDRQNFDRICETVRFSIAPCKDDDCKKCPQPCDPCLKCDCGNGYDGPVSRIDRGPCACLCHALSRTNPKPPDTCWRDVAPNTRIDFAAGVPLACLSVGIDCGNWAVLDVSAVCEARRLVKRNDLLFDLIRGCDLTYIASVQWCGLHRKTVEYSKFANFFPDPVADGNRLVSLTEFVVNFSGPVQASTIDIHCVAMRIFYRDGGWVRAYYVPIVDFVADSSPWATSARIVVDGEWVTEKIKGTPEDLFRRKDYPVQVEIEIRGDYILDRCGQPVDASVRGVLEALDGSAMPGGSGTPGGTLISRFCVEAC
jgi:hypothetical protein